MSIYANRCLFFQFEQRALRSIFNYHSENSDYANRFSKNQHHNDTVPTIYSAQLYWIINELGINDREQSQMKRAMEEFHAEQHRQSTSPQPPSSLSCKHSLPDSDSTITTAGTIHGHRKAGAEIMISSASAPPGCIPFHSFLSIIDQGSDPDESNIDANMQSPSSSQSKESATKEKKKTKEHNIEVHKIHFLRVLEESRRRCDKDGDYLKAKEFFEHRQFLQKEEEFRQMQVVKEKHARDQRKIVAAHEKQFVEFNSSKSFTL